MRISPFQPAITSYTAAPTAQPQAGAADEFGQAGDRFMSTTTGKMVVTGGLCAILGLGIGLTGGTMGQGAIGALMGGAVGAMFGAIIASAP